MTTGVTVDGFLGGRLSIAQPERGAHRAGLDAVLLAACLGPETAGEVVDLGAGVGVAGLAVLARCPAARATLVEIDPATADLARRNLAGNGLSDRGGVVVADVTVRQAERIAAGLSPDMADHLIMNPPFHPADRSRPSPAADRSRAHAIDPRDLDAWMRCAASLLKPSGTLTVIYRADELPRLLAAAAARFGSLVVLPCLPTPEEPATRVLLRARPQGRAPFRLLPGLVLHEGSGVWRPEAEAVLRGASLDRPWW